MLKKIRLTCWIFYFGFVECAFAATAVSNVDNQDSLDVKNNGMKNNSAMLAKIADDYFEQHVILDPLEGSATTGEERFHDKIAITISPKYRKKDHNLAINTLDKLARVDFDALNSEDQITYKVLQQKMQDQLEGEAFPTHLLPIDQYGGLPVYIAQFGTGQDIQPLATPLQYQHYLKRLEQLPRWIDQAISNMKEGIKRDFVQPKALIVSGLPSLKALTVQPVENNPFYLAVKNIPADFSADDKQKITAAYVKVIKKKLIPAAEKLANFMEQEYLPNARETAGVGVLPHGEAYYRYAVKYHTTTDMTPSDIHQLGLREVARIHGEMKKIQKLYNFEGSLTEFLQWQGRDEQFRPFTSEQQVLDQYEAINKKIEVRLPELFGRIPTAPLAIRPEPELTRATASDHYNPPAPDGSRPGIFYTVIQDPKDYSFTEMTSLLLHEGQPGHHFHIALQQELTQPKFRKYGWITAFGEGWALYAETLGKEMGLYDDPVQYLGHLKLELIRAVRLVTDTGLHAKGWSREKTIKYMMDTEGSTESSARRSTERYMAWPGQALAYKIGSLKIQEMREKAKQQLGVGFSLREYHDLVLSDGVLPLSILEEKVSAWIADKKKILIAE